MPAPQNAKSTTEVFPAVSFLNSRVSRFTMGGSIFGISMRQVKPPEAAARDTLAQSSRKLKDPGSIVWQWVSMAPGNTWIPVASITRSAWSDGPQPIFAILPSRIPRSACLQQSSSTKVPFFISKSYRSIKIPL